MVSWMGLLIILTVLAVLLSLYISYKNIMSSREKVLKDFLDNRSKRNKKRNEKN